MPRPFPRPPRRSTHPTHQRDSPAAPPALSDHTNLKHISVGKLIKLESPILRVAVCLGEFIFNSDVTHHSPNASLERHTMSLQHSGMSKWDYRIFIGLNFLTLKVFAVSIVA